MTHLCSFTWRNVKQCHRHRRLCREDGVVRHGPLLREGQAPQFSCLCEGLFELEGHVFRAKN